MARAPTASSRLRRLLFRRAPARGREGARDPLGPAGERAAARLLRRRGFRVLGRNVRVPMGEADIVCMAPDRRTPVIVEVKTRRTGDGDPASRSPKQRAPEASVTAHKRRKLLAIARHLARANGWLGRPVRVDVVAVEWPDRGRPILRHHEDVLRLR